MRCSPSKTTIFWAVSRNLTSLFFIFVSVLFHKESGDGENEMVCLLFSCSFDSQLAEELFYHHAVHFFDDFGIHGAAKLLAIRELPQPCTASFVPLHEASDLCGRRQFYRATFLCWMRKQWRFVSTLLFTAVSPLEEAGICNPPFLVKGWAKQVQQSGRKCNLKCACCGSLWIPPLDVIFHFMQIHANHVVELVFRSYLHQTWACDMKHIAYPTE